MSDSQTAPANRAVFLSYASQDVAAALRICTALRAAGVEVWFDQDALVGGDAWDQKIRGQIGACTLFVPLISAATQARHEGYFRLEWRMAAQRTHMMTDAKPFLVPVVIDATREPEAHVPAEFKAVQWTRLAEGVTAPQFVERIKRLLAPPSVRPTPPSQVAIGEVAGFGNPALRQRRRPLGWLVVATAVAVLAIAAFFMLRKPAATAKSIAVLPFANLGADKNDEYLGDGMTEELLNVFAKLPKLKVAARTSSFYFKGRNLPIAEVGKQLGVAYVLEGSMRRTGNKLRITAQLSNVADGYHLWSETYDRDMTDLLAIETEVSQQVVKALQVTLGMAESRAFAKRATENPEAHRLYLLGRHHFMKFSQAGWTAALDYFNQAIRADPGYALAYCGISDTYGWAGGMVLPGNEAWRKAKEAAEMALEIDSNLAEAHLSLGGALVGMFEWERAEHEMRRAIALDPTLPLAHNLLAWLLVLTGRFDEGLAESKVSVELEPLSAFYVTDYGFCHYMARRFDGCVAQLKKAIELDGNYAYAHLVMSWPLREKGNFDEALAAVRQARALDDIPWYAAHEAYVLAKMGDKDGAMKIIRELETAAHTRYVSPGAFLIAYVGLGDFEKAFAFLDTVVMQQDSTYWMTKSDPIYDPLRPDNRFKVMQKKVGLDK